MNIRSFISGATLAATAAVLSAPCAANADYIKSFEITFPGYTGSESLANFPVLVRLSAARNDFKYAACKLPNGGDVRFFDADGTTVLPSEVDTWDPDGESLVWVRVPSLTSTTNIICRYGNNSPDAVNPADVWSEGYVGVWHLNESALPLADSSATAANFTGTSGSSAAPGYGSTGVVGKALDLCLTDGEGAGATHHGGVKIADNGVRDGTPMLDGFTACTIEMWSFQNWHDSVNHRYILSKRVGTKSDIAYNLYSPNSSHQLILQMATDSSPDSSFTLVSAKSAVSVSNWVHQAFTWDNAGGTNGMGRACTFINGVRGQDKKNASASLMNDSSAKLYLGYTGSDTTCTATFPGVVDELRISNVARSTDWVKATHDTVNNPGFANYTLPADEADPWAGYAYRFTVAFPNYSGSALANFPVLVKVAEDSPAGFRYSDCLKPSGGDLRFASSDGTPLSSEVDTWDENGVSLVWVKVPSLSASTKIFAYYGNTRAPEVDSTDVWSEGYAGVWHLGETARPLKDSTTNGLDFTSTSGSTVSGSNDSKIDYTAAGVLGGGVAFDQNSDHRGAIIAFDPDSRLSGTKTLTVEIWANPSVSAMDPDGPMISRYLLLKSGFIKSAYGTYFNVDSSKSPPTVSISSFTATTNATTASARTLVWSNASSTAEEMASICNKWNYFAMTHDNVTDYKQRLYRDGRTTSVGSGNIMSGYELPADGGTLALGNNGAGSANAFPGTLDELRISRVVRSPDWLNATYRTIADHEAFTTYSLAARNQRGLATIIIYR